MDRYSFSTEKRAALESLRQPFAVYQFIDKRVVTLILSDGFCELFGYADREEAVYDMDHDMYKDTHPDDVARIANAAVRFATEGGRYEVVYRTRRKNSTAYTVVHAVGEHIYTEDGVRLAQIWYMDEGTCVENATPDAEIIRTMSRALHEQSMLNASHYDFLTGLPNRTYFFELAEAGKDRLLRDGGLPVLLYIDFQGMKFYNTRHGFAAGDQILQSFARILVRSFSNENCCRIGGDHFAVLTEGTGLEDKLNAIFREFGRLSDGKTPPVHVGIYPYHIENVPVSTACDRAKFACAGNKGSYASGFSYYRGELREDTMLRQYILENLDTALREKWIQVYLQPIIRAVNEKVSDVEALARWIDPKRGLLSPASFIPALEEAGLIYKLDLYMVDQVLEMIRIQLDNGLSIVPHSINLSRSDFDVCDIVEEIRRRVDEAGADRSLITIEITESVIGGNFDFMKEQVERFRSLGFPVWMDDFGSGYSSLDVLQSIRFDLVKFDMSFMRKLDQNEKGRILLTELMRMATSLGLDTVCEGVETREQARFLKEIGCSKLQGFYYSKPISLEQILRMHRDKTLIAHENPQESEYYESIGRVNLFDLGVVADEEADAFQNYFSTLPIAVLEVMDGTARYIRSNRSYQEFMERFFKMDELESLTDPAVLSIGYGQTFIATVKQCCEGGGRAFFDETMPDGAVVHSFVRRVSVNPVTGATAIAIAVLSVTRPNESMTYAHIAKSLAADYYNIFVIDMDTNAYVEYSSQVGGEELSIIRRGEEFFESARRDTMTRIYEEDREPFLRLFTKENVVRELNTQGVFLATYRLIDSGFPVYVNMKITRMQGGNRIILGISIIDTQMRQQEEEKRLRREKTSLGRIAALAPNFTAIYVVDAETERFFEYGASEEYAELGFTKQGEDFFTQVRKDAPDAIDPQDLERHLRIFTKDNVLAEIRRHGVFVHNYRLRINGRSVPFSLKAKLVREDDGEKIIIGVNKVFSNDSNLNESEIVFTHIAHALARGYTDLYYVDMDTDEFIEFHTDDNLGVLTEARRGADFFVGCKRDARLFVHPEDQAAFVKVMDRDFLSAVLEKSSVYDLVYRRIKGDRTFYVNLKASRMEDDKRLVVIAVSDIDELMRKRRAEERIQEERIIYERLHALTGNFIVVYVVDPETDHYREFSATDDYTAGFEQAKTGEHFFEKVREVARQYNDPEDLNRFLTAFTKKQVLGEIARSGIFTLGYRLMMEGRSIHCQMKAAIVEEKEGPRLIVGLNDIDAQVRQEELYSRRLAQAQAEASIDALTGVRNKHAYMAAEAQIDRRIAEHRQPPFAMVMLDVNDLKKINDTAGHQAGDRYLRDACKVICDIFKHSPVFRIGGDEFAVFAQGSDYACIEDRMEKVRAHNAGALQSGGILIACGMACFEDDARVVDVLERADQNMYENKNALKAAYHTSTE